MKPRDQLRRSMLPMMAGHDSVKTIATARLTAAQMIEDGRSVLLCQPQTRFVLAEARVKISAAV